MRVTLIHNPGAGKRSKTDAARLTALVRDAGHEVRYQSTKEDWEAILGAPADVIAVAGGDGTVSRVAKTMAGRDTPMTVLPAGTANNIARTLGLTRRPLEELIHGWAQARRMKLDVGAARGPWGQRRFIEGVGIGLFPARISQVDSNETIESLERGDAIVTYALQLLKEELERCQPVHVEASLDGRDVSGDYLLFEALNIPYVGPNLFLAPDSEQGDGNFDLVLVRDSERERLHQYLAQWQEGKPRVAVLPSLQGRSLHVEWQGFGLHVDDEVYEAPARPSGIDLRIEDHAVRVLVPEANK